MNLLIVRIVYVVSCIRVILSASSSSNLPRRDDDQAQESEKRSPRKQIDLPDLNFPPPEEAGDEVHQTSNLESKMNDQEKLDHVKASSKRYINERKPKRMTAEEFAKSERERKRAYRKRKGAEWRSAEGRKANQRTKERLAKNPLSRKKWEKQRSDAVVRYRARKVAKKLGIPETKDIAPFFGMAVNIEGHKGGKGSQKQDLTPESTNAESHQKVILPDLNLSPPPSHYDEEIRERQDDSDKQVNQTDQPKKKKRRRYPFMTKEEKKVLWREEKRKTRAKLSADVRIARSRRDSELKKKRIANAPEEERQRLEAKQLEIRNRFKRKERAKLQEERARKGKKSSHPSKYDP